MKMIIKITMVLTLALCGCAVRKPAGIPVEDWPEFIPLSQIERYVGFKYSTPTLGAIYGGLRNLKIMAEAETVTMFVLGDSGGGFVSMKRSPEKVGFRPIAYMSDPLEEADRTALQGMLLDYDSYGDETLCPFVADTGFRFQCGELYVDVMIGFECGGIGIYSSDSPMSSRARALAPDVLRLTESLAQKYGNETSNKGVQAIGDKSPQPDP